MDMIALDARKLRTANVHHVVHQRFKQPTTHIAIVLIQLLMHIDTSLGRPLWRRTSDLLLRNFRVLTDTDPINPILNRRFSVFENVAETWG